jgi:hypothetical protein
LWREGNKEKTGKLESRKARGPEGERTKMTNGSLGK